MSQVQTLAVIKKSNIYLKLVWLEDNILNSNYVLLKIIDTRITRYIPTLALSIYYQSSANLWEDIILSYHVCNPLAEHSSNHRAIDMAEYQKRLIKSACYSRTRCGNRPRSDLKIVHPVRRPYTCYQYAQSPQTSLHNAFQHTFKSPSISIYLGNPQA